MREVFGSVLELVGRTPLVRLNRLADAHGAEVLVKLESLNPGGSLKDRIAVAMVEQAEREGRLRPGSTIVEPTSGNTGIGLAMVAAVRGYRLILTMPEDMSVERRRLLSRYGAEFLLTPAAEGMSGAVEAAEGLVAEHSDYFMPQQFTNLANPEVHRLTTGPEIIAATQGRVDAFVAGIGTGGTLTGVGRALKAEVLGVLVVGVEPARSPVLRGAQAAPHGIQGIGASFVPEVLDLAVVDEVVDVADEDAYTTSVRLMREEGISAGVSSGAAVFGALQVAARLGSGKTVVTVVADAGERYLSLALPW
ncbi:MAG: cysteine synthase A [Dehalococcoidales bacterium]|nr:cysteine synthase A [Dehalococcoidales bacterium]